MIENIFHYNVQRLIVFKICTLLKELFAAKSFIELDIHFSCTDDE